MPYTPQEAGELEILPSDGQRVSFFRLPVLVVVSVLAVLLAMVVAGDGGVEHPSGYLAADSVPTLGGVIGNFAEGFVVLTLLVVVVSIVRVGPRAVGAGVAFAFGSNRMHRLDSAGRALRCGAHAYVWLGLLFAILANVLLQRPDWVVHLPTWVHFWFLSQWASTNVAIPILCGRMGLGSLADAARTRSGGDGAPVFHWWQDLLLLALAISPLIFLLGVMRPSM